jgi:hypothetical protein
LVEAVKKTVMSPSSLFVKAVRSAAKGPALRSTMSPAAFPENQRATEVQHTLEGVSIASVAHEACPLMTYPGWKAVRSPFAKAAKQERLRRNETLPPTDVDHIVMPLLWTFAGVAVQGGGARLLYLKTETGMLRHVWTTERRGGSFHRRAILKSEELPIESWPQHAAELEPEYGNAATGSDDE